MEHWEMTADDVLAMYPGAEASAEDRKQIDLLLTIAEARLVHRIPSLPGRVMRGEVPAVLVKGVLAEVVGRVVTNPFPGVQSMQSGAGPFQMTQRPMWGTDKIRFSKDDLQDLLPGGAGSPARMIRTTIGW